MKRLITLFLALALCLSLAACSSGGDEQAEGGEEKKELPSQNVPDAGEEAAQPHYRDIMVPFEDLIPAERIVILQNTLNFSREGFYTLDTTPTPEELTMDGQTAHGYRLTHALGFLTHGYEAGAVVTDAAGAETSFSKEELEGMYVIIEDFQSLTLPVLYNPSTGAAVTDFDHLITEGGEMVISIVPEQDRRFPDMFALVGWDDAATNYHVMATDKFFIPVTPEDYDDGELRGALSGAVNGTFPDCAVAQGKINDVIYVERIVS